MLAFEQDICTDFVSFKLFSVIQEPTTLAVVMSGANLGEMLPSMSYIDVSDFKSAKDLSNYLLHLDAHNGKNRKKIHTHSSISEFVLGKMLQRNASKGEQNFFPVSTSQSAISILLEICRPISSFCYILMISSEDKIFS